MLPLGPRITPITEGLRKTYKEDFNFSRFNVKGKGFTFFYCPSYNDVEKS